MIPQTILAPGAPWPYIGGYKAPSKPAPDCVPPSRRAGMDQRAEHILSVLTQTPMHSRELARRLDYSRHAIDRTLRDLTSRKQIRKVFGHVRTLTGERFVFRYEAV